MPLDVSFHPMRTLIDGCERNGTMILADGRLVAVIVRLEGQSHAPEHEGLWKLEAGFGRCDVRDAPLFATPEEAGAWVERTLTRKPA
jgi:hypothetical protein